MFEIELCHRVANRVSYYNAADGYHVRQQEQEARHKAYNQWLECRQWLYQAGLLEEFLQASRYLMMAKSELMMAEKTHAAE